ncbi:MAG: amidohydrolase family protein [Planctomycetota bacterium]
MGPIRLTSGVLAAVIASSAFAQYEPDTIVVRTQKVITGTGEEIEGASIIIEDGEIILVGPALEAPAGARIIDATNEVVMPGIIVPATRFGLPQPQRTGLNGDISVAGEIYFDSLDPTLWLENGVTAVGYRPSGSGIRGIGAAARVAHPDGDYLLNDDAYLSVTFNSQTRDKDTLRSALASAQAAIDAEEEARTAWEESQAEKSGEGESPAEGEDESGDDEPKPEGEGLPDPQPTPDEGGDGEPAEGEDAEVEEESNEFVPPEIDPPLRPVVDLVRGEDGKKALVVVGNASTVVHLEQVLDDYDDLATPLLLGSVDRLPSLAGGGGGFFGGTFGSNLSRVLDLLASFEETIVVPPIMSRLTTTQIQLNVPAELATRGVTLAFRPESDSRGSIENYRSGIATLMKQGLDRETAIKGLTSVPAALLGIDDIVGSIEKGKEADLVFFDGDPLDPTSRVTRVMIEGSFEYDRDGED